MNDLINELSSPTFWFSVVFVGILINLTSSYLRPVIDRVYSVGSNWSRSRSAKRKAKWEARVELFRTCDYCRTDGQYRAIVQAIAALTLLVMGLFAQIIPANFFVGVSQHPTIKLAAVATTFIMMALGLSALNSATSLVQQLAAARAAAGHDHDDG